MIGNKVLFYFYVWLDVVGDFSCVYYIIGLGKISLRFNCMFVFLIFYNMFVKLIFDVLVLNLIFCFGGGLFYIFFSVR